MGKGGRIDGHTGWKMVGGAEIASGKMYPVGPAVVRAGSDSEGKGASEATARLCHSVPRSVKYAPPALVAILGAGRW